MWEYMLLEETDEKKLVQKLNELGNNNWEALAYTVNTLIRGGLGGSHHFVLLKRQREETKA
jgi:hypothetical protein